MATTDDTSLPPTSSPPPPALRSLKRSLLGGVAVVALVALLRLWWGWEADRRIEAVVAAVRARGEPIRVEDYPVDPPGWETAPQNAATDLVAAAAAVRQPQAGWYFPDPVLPFKDEDGRRLDAHLSANASALARAEAALGKPHAAWGKRLRRPVISMLLPELSQQNELNQLLGFASLQAFAHGDDARALRLVRAMVRQSDAMQSFVPFPVVYLASARLGQNGTDTLRQVVHRMPTRPPAIDARREADRLIAELLDERMARAGQLTSAYGQRTMMLDAYESTIRPQQQWPQRFVILPAYGVDMARAVAMFDAAVTSARADGFQAAMAALPADRVREPSPPQRPVLGRVTHTLSDMPFRAGMFAPRSAHAHFQWLLDRRAGATRLAVRMYAMDHGGRLPTDLDALVPAYLPAVPRDPYSAGGAHPLRFRPGSAGGRPTVVYSVGTNGIDDGGEHTTLGPDGRPRHSAPDRWPDIAYELDLPPGPQVEDPHTPGREVRRPPAR